MVRKLEMFAELFAKITSKSKGCKSKPKIVNMFTIQNPNSSGQGYCPQYLHQNEKVAIIESFPGWYYSHSVFIGAGNGEKRKIAHCFKYKNTERCISIFTDLEDGELDFFEFCKSPASGHKYRKSGDKALIRHVKWVK